MPGEHSQTALGLPDAELISEPHFTRVSERDFLFNPDLPRQPGGELPEWINLSPLIPDFPPEEWPDTAR
jgi:hypothetical protein